MVRVIVVGLGPIGVACARAVDADGEMELAGLVDIDPAKTGLSLDGLGEPGGKTPGLAPGVAPTSGPGRGEGPKVVARIAEAAPDGADLAILTTASRFDQVVPTVGDLLDRGLAVVCSCEEMAWPWYRHAALAEQLNADARRAGRAVLGTGVNPGFVMDSLAVVLSSMVRQVRAVRCIRRVDAALRRLPLQVKVGATMTPQAFAERAKAGKIGHMGLGESVAMIAAGLGRKVQPGSVDVTLEAVLADRPIASAVGLIEPGRVAGIHNVGRWSGEGLAIELDLTMAVGLTDPKDVVELNGPVQLRMQIAGGIPGDSATVAALVNYGRALVGATPGLRTMLDIPPAGARGREA
jgi:2,4-diaminopentanoate dehydrogenase